MSTAYYLTDQTTYQLNDENEKFITGLSKSEDKSFNYLVNDIISNQKSFENYL